jgi:predicted kinase
VAGSGKTLIVVAGLPGAGKSHVSRILKRKIAGSLYFDSDLYSKLFMQKQNMELASLPREEQEGLRMACHRSKIADIIKQFSAHDIIIVDTCFDMMASRVLFYGAAESHGFDIIVIEVVCPEEVVRARIAGNRHETERMIGSKDSRLEAYLEMKRRWQPIKGKRFKLDSGKDVEPQINQFLARYNLV